MKRVWKIKYKGWVITHDPYGRLVCYLEKGSELEWCYFGATIEAIKAEIDWREMVGWGS